MYFTIYQITNKINGKIYIGKHQTKNPNDAYYGSGKAITASIKKYGKENFKKEILFVFETETEMNQKEKELITEEFVLRDDTYNLGVGGEGGPHFKGKKHDPEVIKKYVSKRKEYELTPDGRKSIQESNKDRIISDDARIKMSKNKKGKILSEETKVKIAASITGKKHSEETKQKMREAKRKKI